MFLILLIVLVFVCYNDLIYKRIPNTWTFGTMVVGLVYHSAFGGLEGFLISLKGLTTGGMILLPVYLLGVLGAGDVKLWMAVGSITGTDFILEATVWASTVNALGVLFILLRKKALLKSLIMSYNYILSFIKKALTGIGEPPKRPTGGPAIPASPFFALGVFLVYFSKMLV